MPILIVTPVKDSLDTARDTIETVVAYKGAIEYLIFDDHSERETSEWLKHAASTYSLSLLTAKEIGAGASPNQWHLLQELEKRRKGRAILFIESDVRIGKSTIEDLYNYALTLDNPGMIGAVTVDDQDTICYPYGYVARQKGSVVETHKRVSFCCTLITDSFLLDLSINELSPKKSWFDVELSKKSRSFGYKNYILLNQRVYHRPHSSRPWKKEKYRNPIRYYIKKLITGRDSI
ncbi:MAG: hypothetical protein OCD01_10765 [Fibrobacterales bacterium]